MKSRGFLATRKFLRAGFRHGLSIIGIKLQ